MDTEGTSTVIELPKDGNRTNKSKTENKSRVIELPIRMETNVLGGFISASRNVIELIRDGNDKVGGTVLSACSMVIELPIRDGNLSSPRIS